MNISIIHPSRGRPQRSAQTMSDWLTRAGMEVELIVSVDDDDPEKQEYIRLHGGYTVISNPNRSAVDAVNAGAKAATGDVFIVASDDFACPRNWALILEKHLKGKKDFVFKTFDGVQNYIVTLPIMDRRYYERFGYIYYPGYLHMFCDCELSHVSDVLRKIIFRNDILFRHHHYSVTRSAKDEVSKRADSTWNDGKRLYLQRVREKFGLGKDVDVMALSSEGQAHKEWLKKAGI
jgi:glycosyltransferase involved in cell wall biosynthesis